MMADLSPLRLLLVTLAGWINRHQQQVIEYIVEENRVLKEQLKGRRLRLTDDQRRRLAVKGQRLGRRVLRRLRRVLDEFVAHYHRERNHQGLGNALIAPAPRIREGTHVRCRERLGGLLRYYHRAA
jgi:hypothetical protein